MQHKGLFSENRFYGQRSSDISEMITENLVKRLISPYLKRMKSRAEPVIILHNGVPRNLREGRRKSSSRHAETWNAPKKSAKKHTANSSHILEDTYECRYSWALACVLGWSLIWLASFSPPPHFRSCICRSGSWCVKTPLSLLSKRALFSLPLSSFFLPPHMEHFSSLRFLGLPSKNGSGSKVGNWIFLTHEIRKKERQF